MRCPCCSNLNYLECCQPILERKCFAKTPEQLMRSRFCAYALKNIDHIYDTYASTTRVHQSKPDLAQWAKQTKWLKLEIVATDNTQKHPTVTFNAYYLEKDKYCCISECSNFIEEDEKWFYLDGEILSHQQLQRISRNDFCPCGSELKFKKCCGR